MILSLAIPAPLAGDTTVRVDEGKTRLHLGAGKSDLKLAVTNASSRHLSTHIQLDFLDPEDRIIKAFSHESVLRTGFNLLEIPLGGFFSDVSKEKQAGFLWSRLRYQVKPAGSGEPHAAVEGVISVSEISPQPFELKLGVPQYAVEGTRCRVHVFARHPVSARPVRGVTTAGTLTIEDEKGEHVLRANGVTDASGYAAVDFELPGNLEDPDATVTVKARLGGVVKEARGEIEFQDRAEILLSTDKPLYQPGQSLRVRVLAFDASRRALAQALLTLSIKDPEGTGLYRSELTTSRFGEADVNWTIPENARLGDYSVEVYRREGGPYDARAMQSIKISRYELPNFTISFKPDRPYYLTNQNAEIAIRADYLFGQPVKDGFVRVAREIERRWNYREQKWETEEGQTIEGALDGQGRFLAKIDLESEHGRLAGIGYQRYTDLRFAAYVTDRSTNRTEERRFDLRLTKDPIHVYVTQNRGVHPEEFPLEFFVATFYADGTPAKCDVAVRAAPAKAGRRTASGAVEGASQLLKVIKTNRYGVAKVSGLRATSGWPMDGGDPLLSLVAEDRKGNRGEHTESFWTDDSPAIRIHTDKTLYRAGQPLEVEIESSLTNARLVLDIVREGRVLHSQVVRLHKGRAFIVIPHAPEFKDQLTLAAYPADNLSDDDYGTPPYGVRSVLYPRNRELQVDLRVGQAYEPGQEAMATFRIRSADNVGQKSLLGVVVLDKAVEERARTDVEFGSAHGFYRTYARLLGFDRELSGVTRRDLDRLDLSRPVPEDLEVAADALLNSWADYYPPRLRQDDAEEHPQDVFKNLIATMLAPLKKTLEDRYAKAREYPRDEASLRNLLSGSGLVLSRLRDPWNNSYRMVYSVDRSLDVMEIISAGPDKRFESSDDILALKLTWSYFRPRGEGIDRVVNTYHQRTGGFIRDVPTLKKELLGTGEDLDSWRDRWGRAYQIDFGILGTHFNLTVRSSGPNRAFEPLDAARSDDFPLWTAGIDYAAETRLRVDQALNLYFRGTGGFPETQEQFNELLRLSRTDERHLIDPWGHRYYPIFKTEYLYSDRPTVVTYAEHLRTGKRRTSFVPVTRQIQFLVLRSTGPDGAEGTPDDFDVATFSKLLTEQSSRDATPQPAPVAPVLQGSTGAILGLVTDASGAVIPGVAVKATHSSASQNLEAVSDENGRYLLRNLPPGRYEVRFELAGFRLNVIRDVPVQSSTSTELNVTLVVGALAETVTVSAAPGAILQTESAMVVAKYESFSLRLPIQTSTPRPREYFPETLVWQPSQETGSDGRAQLKFKLADNITTWKMAVVASTMDGRIGMTEKEILAFQPFFLEHDPPRVLTEGDEISLPVLVRNYLNKEQAVDLSIKPETWFESLEPAARRARIKAGETGRETFRFKAVASVKEGKQRITAVGTQASDAIEKPVTVHPDGEEVVQIATQVFNEFLRLELTIPAEAIQNTPRAELKIYPNLMAHLIEGVEGILQRPYGCGEQTISSTYPSLMLLRFHKQSGREAPLIQKARRYLQAGCERLLGYRTGDGGFSYWGRGSADVALTAYALRFLRDAEGLVPLDQRVVMGASEWLVRQQQQDGSWVSMNWQGQTDRGRTLKLTAFVARVLSMPGLSEAVVQSGRQPKPPQLRDPVRLALQFLQARTEESDEPYALASLALAALNLGDREAARAALESLKAMAKKEGDATYWHLETNTPFYGWGLPGRLETTALAVRALAMGRDLGIAGSATDDAGASPRANDASESIIRQALLFLLRNKDRYGLWHSTQATVNVLDALMSLLGNEAGNSDAAGPAEVFVNGVPAGPVSLSGNGYPASVITVDLSKFLAPGRNRIEMRRSDGSAAATAQLVESHYVPWAHSSAAEPKIEPDSARALRLAIRFDKTEGKVGEEIACHVEAERIGFRGYGMLLGEIGLPPGADVDRSSLDEAIKSAGWDLYRYDVLPDRLIVYLWPRAGGTKFHFKFRPRYGLKARTAASVLYDYYNPEARAVVAPAGFQVR